MARHQPNNAPQRLSSQPFIINPGQPWLLQPEELQEQTGIKSSGRYGAAIKVVLYKQQHFPCFEKEILEPLEKYYRVLRTG